MAKPIVSVIIVNYNAGNLLLKAVRSVLRFPGVEVVVADNASRDGSFIKLEEKIKSDRLILIDNGANLGFGKAINPAVAKSHGEYVFLLNPDAELSQSALTQMLKTAKAWNNRAIVAPALLNSDGSAQPSCYRPQTIANAIKEYWLGVKGSYSKYLPSGKKPLKVHAAVAAAWLIHRSVWEELGGLNEKFFLYFEDLDMCDRAHQHNIPIIYDPKARVMHAHGVSSRTNPIVLKLFTDSAWNYHGKIKKIIIDTIIHIRDFFVPPVSTKKLFGISLSFAAFVLFASTLAYFLLPARYAPYPALPEFVKQNFLLWSWGNFDGEHYLNIARNGYSTVRGQSEYAFFPLYPLLINLLSQVGINPYFAGLLISFSSLLGFIFVLVRWASKFMLNPLSLLWLILLSPGAVFLTSVYTEPLFLLLVILTFFFSDNKQWGRAIIATALATATRINGIFLVIYLLLRMGRDKLKALLGLTGLGLYMFFLYFKTGNAFAWYSAQSGWGKATATAPWVTLGNYLSTITINFVPDLTHLVVALEVILTASLIYLVIRYWYCRQPLAYKWYATLSLALPLLTGSLGSIPRFSLALFPIFILIPSLNKQLSFIYRILFLASAIIGIILFTRGYWYA